MSSVVCQRSGKIVMSTYVSFFFTEKSKIVIHIYLHRYIQIKYNIQYHNIREDQDLLAPKPSVSYSLLTRTHQYSRRTRDENTCKCT